MDSVGFGLFMGSVCVGLIGVVALMYRFRRVVDIALQLVLLVVFAGAVVWLAFEFLLSSDPRTGRAGVWTLVLAPIAGVTAAGASVVKFIDRLSLTDWLVLCAMYMLYHVGRGIDRLAQRVDRLADKLEPTHSDDIKRL